MCPSIQQLKKSEPFSSADSLTEYLAKSFRLGLPEKISRSNPTAREKMDGESKKNERGKGKYHRIGGEVKDIMRISASTLSERA